MTNSNDLIVQKKNLMNEMLERLSNWDESTDEAIQILEENNQSIQSMQKIDPKLTSESLIAYNEKYLKKWQEIITKQRELNQSILTKKDKVQEQLVQMGKKDKIVSNYISIQNQSAFIEKKY